MAYDSGCLKAKLIETFTNVTKIGFAHKYNCSQTDQDKTLEACYILHTNGCRADAVLYAGIYEQEILQVDFIEICNGIVDIKFHLTINLSSSRDDKGFEKDIQTAVSEFEAWLKGNFNNLGHSWNCVAYE